MTDEHSSDEALPWLAPVEDEDEPRGISARRMFLALIVVLFAGLIVVATFFWLGHRETTTGGPPQLIKAPQAPYKVKPTSPGGLDISGESETAFETSAGEDKDSQLDLNKMPKISAAKPMKQETKPKAEATGGAAEAKPAPEEETKPTGGSGSIVQLGAFANQAQAERAWTALTARFPGVASLNKMIVPFPGGIRLRAAASSSTDAKEVCQTLRAAGENCFVAQ
ncbi:MAG TPA: SPOR domain-containing protein [Sphingomicrobium sp.]|nr:SPOR domain-containing protein [Sphingomicrobium sp.]